MMGKMYGDVAQGSNLMGRELSDVETRHLTPLNRVHLLATPQLLNYPVSRQIGLYVDIDLWHLKRSLEHLR